MDINSLKIHDCSELPEPANFKQDVDCLEKIDSLFVPIKWAGKGSSAMVLYLMKRAPDIEFLVVKITRLIFDDELHIACELNQLADATSLFPHTYGWLICDKIPQRWISILSDKQKSHYLMTSPSKGNLFMFVFLQKVQTIWKKIPQIVESRYRVTLFLILHGLYVANKRIGFIHRDIHAENIMMEPHTQNTLNVRYGQVDAEVRTAFTPRLIDYGESVTTRHTANEGRRMSDIYYLEEMFLTRLEDDAEIYDKAAEELKEFKIFRMSSEWSEASESYNEVGSNVIIPLLNHSYFDVPEIQRHKVKRRAIEVINRCFVCCSTQPKYMIEQTQKKYFCNKKCYDRIGGICQFIK